MAIDIFNPEVSKIVSGIVGKTIMIYGANGTGKTSNMVKAPKPLVIAFENGLSAINGVPYARVRKWTDFQSIVKQLTSDATRAKAQEAYQTIIVDGVDLMEDMADSYVAGCYGVTRVREGNEGFGLWKEYSAEIKKQLLPLTNSGYTCVFIDHDGEREFKDAAGNKYSMIYPRGDKRVIDPILSLAAIVGYTQLQADTETGKPVNSTLYLRGNSGFMAKTHFEYLTRCIPEWDYDKLVAEIDKAISLKEKATGVKATSFDAALAEEAEKAATEAKEIIPIDTLIERVGLMAKQIAAKNGNLEEYASIMVEVLGTKEFKCNKATEAQREQVEALYGALLEKGYSYEIVVK